MIGNSQAAGRHSYAYVDLDAIRHNVREIRGQLQQKTHLAAVVKADAYGHGSIPVARAAIEAGADMLAVAMADEAVPLRNAGLDGPILVIGPSNSEQLALGVTHGLDLCVADVESLLTMEEIAAQTDRIARMHLKIDTGMGRIGVRPGAELNELLAQARQCRHVDVAGLFTHFARADEYDDSAPTLTQFRRFREAVDAVAGNGYDPILHVSNSAATQNIPELDLDMVRFGISLYGYPAGQGKAVRELHLKRAMRVEAEVSVVRDVRAGSPIGYGGTFVASRTSRIATVQIGYGDGYSRQMSNRGSMIVQRGTDAYLAPVVGRVCMDMTMIDVTDCPDGRSGERVVVMGASGNTCWDAADIARECNTIPYEVLCGFTQRLPRVYCGTESRDDR